MVNSMESLRGPERVLVIDDDVELCRLVTRFMTGEGFTIDCVTSGGDGVKRVLSGDYALVMLDVMMPDMNRRRPDRRDRVAASDVVRAD